MHLMYDTTLSTNITNSAALVPMNELSYQKATDDHGVIYFVSLELWHTQNLAGAQWKTVPASLKR
jgi:hypothetical protein